MKVPFLIYPCCWNKVMLLYRLSLVIGSFVDLCNCLMLLELLFIHEGSILRAGGSQLVLRGPAGLWSPKAGLIYLKLVGEVSDIIFTRKMLRIRRFTEGVLMKCLWIRRYLRCDDPFYRSMVGCMFSETQR